MKKRIKVFLSVLISLIILLSSFTAFGAVYQPDVKLYSQSYLLVNLDDSSYPIVAEKDADKRMYPASLTKIVTAMITLNKIQDIGLKTSMSQEAYDVLLGTGAQIAGIQVGDTLSVEQLLYLTLVHSACDATEILAEYVAGSRDKFVVMMNDYAKSLGCENTNFTNPDGLPAENQYTTANDLLKIALDALKNDTFVKISTTKQYEYNGMMYYHSNLMLQPGYLSYYYPYAEGIKTGSTTDAGYCLITKASKDGYNYLAIVLGAPVLDYNKDGYDEKCSFIDAASLFKWAFNSLKFSTLFEEGEIVSEVAVKNGKKADTVQLVADKKTNAIVKSSFDKSTAIIEVVDKPEEIVAPVRKGDTVCKANVIFGDETVATVDLVAAEDIELSTFLSIINSIKGFFSLTAVKIVLIVAVLFAVLYVILIINNVKKRNERNSNRSEKSQSGNRSSRQRSSSNTRRERRGYDDNDDYIPPPAPKMR
ncbi:MAG: D-alanyl-D-alanine carboxypeptidase [Eubacterium sp.]|nr:D-alanyl-D-alanine carboxypeptidase [Eubacterium sp.]